ncbi:MAG: thiamine-monophosphate kinase [Actinomycetota bacterium]|nr:thiamine-monophosphate kinase [Actinomycetota bacterium]
MGEFAAIERIRRLLPDPPPGEVWSGDDAAVVGDGLLLAIDAVVEGVHFATDTPLEDVGWKVVAANVSDIAAMGGRPGHLLASVVGPPGTYLDRLAAGMAEAAAAYGCPIVGGDLANGTTIVVTVAITGHVDGPPGPVLRSGARPGDVLYVTGALGANAASGWRLRPQARVNEGEQARRAGATAMIDVSDGLIADLNHIAEASGVGYELDDDIPVADGATRDQALHGGEDYELIVAAPPASQVDAIRIGACTADPAQRQQARGWEHDFR